MLLLLSLVVLGGCGSGEDGDGDADSDSDTDADSDSDSDSDADSDSDTKGAAEIYCFDGTDDDGDGPVDCADSDCSEQATCVPVAEELGLEAGVTVAEGDPCPAGFEGGEVLVYRGLGAPECEGCGCAPGATTCSVSVYTYTSNAACTNDDALSGGTLAGALISDVCTPEPIYDGTTYGARAEIVADTSCAPDGVASLVPPTWTETLKFCRASDVGGGCAASEACVPVSESGTQCALADGAVACDGYASTATDWYTSYDDAGACGACECTANGGNCNAVSVAIGSDWSCTDEYTLSDGEKVCISEYSPPARLLGSPEDPDSCEASASYSGELLPTGPTTLCCNP